MTLNLAPAEDLTPRQPPVITPSSVTCNGTGFIWREYLVRLPIDFVADDLKEPSIWRLVQNQIGFKTHDRVYLVAYDESWVAEALVASADKDKVVLAKPRITNFPERFEKLFQDDEYRVTWMGSGYCVVRKSDGHRMTQPVNNAALAERELVMLHPRPVR